MDDDALAREIDDILQSPTHRQSTGMHPLIQTGIILAVVAMMAAILVPNYIRARAPGRGTSCKSNLKNIGTALEMYSMDSAGKLPLKLGLLTPNFLKTMPSCPSVGYDTYTRSYVADVDHAAYTVFCAGHNHGGVGYGPDHPQYSSRTGLIER